MSYPDWWVQGQRVVSPNGTTGALRRTADSAWVIDIEQGRHKEQIVYTTVMDPDPKLWTVSPDLKMNADQIAAIVFDADRRFLKVMGRGNLSLEWEAVSYEDKAAGQPRCAGLDGDGFADVRLALERSIRETLQRYCHATP
jgi:hypothetical protein